MEGNTTGHDNVINHQDQNYSYQDDKKPWDTKSTFNPTPGKSESLEEFISELEKYLFDPKNIRRVKDNLTREERVCLKRLSQWNKDNNCTKMFIVQDEGSRLVLESKERYKEKMLQYLEDISVFREDEDNQSRENEEKVNNWVMKWEREEQIGREEAEYIICGYNKPAKVYANIKTHKKTWPYRYIVSCNNSAIEKLAQWVEYQLKSLARQHPAYLKDTKHLLKFIEDLNDQQGPFQKEQVIMISRDIENFYPSCETNKCIEAIELLLNQRTIKCPSTECILEAVSITMSSNSAHFSNRYFTQIDGARIGSPDSGSVTDIYGAIHIDKKLMEESPIKPQNYKR